MDQAEPGRSRWCEVLYRACAAQRELEEHDAHVDLIRLMRMEIRDPGSPGTRRALLEMARARLAR